MQSVDVSFNDISHFFGFVGVLFFFFAADFISFHINETFSLQLKIIGECDVKIGEKSYPATF